MSKEDFKRFVEQKTDEAKRAPTIDWAAQKEEWIRHLADFYAMIHGYLADFLKAGTISITSSSVFLTEEHIGAYEAPSRAIFIGSDKVTLTPIGTLLIGARGRVDMTGPAGTVKFVFTGKHSNGVRITFGVQGEAPFAQQPKPEKAEVKEEYVWRIATPPPKVQFIELKAETFFNALTEVLNG